MSFEFAWKLSQSLVIFGIPALMVTLSGIAVWSLIVSSIWIPCVGFLSHDINKDLARAWAEAEERQRRGGR